MTIPGFTSTGSKRPDALFGAETDMPTRMVRAEGCRVWDAEGREYLDTIMGLGAVALGYGHPAVVAAAMRAVREGTCGPLPPVLEQQVAEALTELIPGAEAVRFLKTGAEAVAAAVRIARAYTGRDRLVTCGYHGWLDWCQDELGVPSAVTDLRREVKFNDLGDLERTLDAFGPVAAIVLEPVIDGSPDTAWLRGAWRAAERSGAVLVFDEIKTAFRIAVGGAAERYGVTPHLTVVGKALGNGFPLAAVCGGRDLMDMCTRTWVSSTLATESVSLAAALSVIEVFRHEPVVEHLERVGTDFLALLERVAQRAAGRLTVRGLPQMCYLQAQDETVTAKLAAAAARRGLLFKRTAYNFVSLAHTEQEIRAIGERLEAAVDEATC